MSSIHDFFGRVVVLDRVRDAIGEVVLASLFGSVVCAVFCCLDLSRVRDEINGAIGASDDHQQKQLALPDNRLDCRTRQ